MACFFLKHWGFPVFILKFSPRWPLSVGHPKDNEGWMRDWDGKVLNRKCTLDSGCTEGRVGGGHLCFWHEVALSTQRGPEMRDDTEAGRRDTVVLPVPSADVIHEQLGVPRLTPWKMLEMLFHASATISANLPSFFFFFLVFPSDFSAVISSKR